MPAWNDAQPCASELAGCDLLTISPDLLEELDGMQGTLERKLSPADAKHSSIAPIDMTEKMFRWMLNEDPMATEKLAEGIRNFYKDLTKLEDYVLKFVTETVGVK